MPHRPLPVAPQPPTPAGAAGFVAWPDPINPAKVYVRFCGVDGHEYYTIHVDVDMWEAAGPIMRTYGFDWDAAKRAQRLTLVR